MEKKVPTVQGIYQVMRCPVCGRDTGVHQGRFTVHGPDPSGFSVTCPGSGRLYDEREG